jgi:ABC-2 type transport system ATP-binding protein
VTGRSNVAGVAVADDSDRSAAVADAGSDLRPATPAVDAPAIETHELRKQFGRIVALAGLTMTVRPGEVFGFLGPNGAGKTTAVKLLLGLSRPSAGEGRVLGAPLGEVSARRRIGYLPELTYYYKFLTAEELLRFYAKIFGLSRAETDKRIPELLKLVELEHASKRPIKSYSKGMQQRVGVAQALINNPDLLILDEPTSGLDPLGRMKVREIIQRLKNEGKTVFFSSHELGEVETVCDRVAIVHQGELKAVGGVAEISAGHANLEQAFLKIIGFANSSPP